MTSKWGHRGSWVIWFSMVSLATANAAGQPPEDLVAPGAKVEKLADGFVFTEGPACDAKGNVFFSDVHGETTYKWSIDGELTTFRKNTGRANGLYFDRNGDLLACEGGSRRLTKISSDKKVTVLADRFQGKRFNSPNDLWIDPQGGVYFTDPRYGKQDELEQDGFHVYYLRPGGDKVVRVIDDLVKPNGVVGTADGGTLYVADPGADMTYVYAIKKNGQLSSKKLFVSQGSDGLTLDEKGNLYVTNQLVVIYSPAAKKLGAILTPEFPANVCFGGADRSTLFITARKGLYSIRMQVKGQ